MNNTLVANNLPIPSALGSLDAYIGAVYQIPVLSVEEEQDLAHRFIDDQDLTAARSLVLKDSDVVIMMGARLNWLLSHGKGKNWGDAPKKFVQLDIEPREMDSNVEIVAPVVGDMGSCVDALLAGGGPLEVPRAAAAVLRRLPWLTAVPAYLVGVGVRPEHVRIVGAQRNRQQRNHRVGATHTP